MKSFLLIIVLLPLVTTVKAQKIDSIFFNLYTDSLKKGTHNYINLDGKKSNGTWLPLTAKELDFSATAGKFTGNSLFVDKDFAGEKITVKAILKENLLVSKEITIYIKKSEENERLKTAEEVMQTKPAPAVKKKEKPEK